MERTHYSERLKVYIRVMELKLIYTCPFPINRMPLTQLWNNNHANLYNVTEVIIINMQEG
jgi:hypothetical protein